METLQAGQMAPRFTAINDLKEIVRLDGLLQNGHLLLAFIHGTWCPHCVQTLYRLQRATRTFAAAGVEVAVVAMDDPAALRIFRQTAPVPIAYALIGDKDQSVHRAFHLENLSAYVVVDRAGLIRGVFLDHDHLSYPGHSTIIRSLKENQG